MKVEVHIDSHFQEEAVMITAPALSARVEKIRDFVEELDQKGRLRAKKDGEAYLIESQLFQRFYIENRQVIGETMTDQFILTGPLYQLSEDLPTFFLKISQSEIINTKEIDQSPALYQWRIGANLSQKWESDLLLPSLFKSH